MYDYDGFIDSGVVNATPLIPYMMDSNSYTEERLAELDQETRNEVRKHVGEFHSREEMEMFINHISKKNNDKESFK